ncbi:MAG TPA: arylsulfatase [Candidatus Hydrogenedentes bacterium]|nr:arylsulfatase [Candidatus Hydrogenedentota bacterium]
MTRRAFLQQIGAGCAVAALGRPAPSATEGNAMSGRPPHIVYILADDMGYGDPGCCNANSKIPTPHMGRIAREGMLFTDAHSGSAVCTPTRYGILTGRYSWRSTLKSGVLEGYSPPLIEPGRLTVAAMLKECGYRTACVGKWHLGLDWATKDDESANAEKVDYEAPVAGGPTALGFDYFFGISASLDMPPYCYIENDRVVASPTGRIEEQRGQGFFRAGAIAPGFRHGDVLPTLTERAVACIDRHAAEHADAPLFLYFPLNAPHTPMLPTPAFAGKTDTNAYGDFIAQVDATVGDVLAALERHGMDRDTLLIVTSDNGPPPPADMLFLGEKGHHPSYHFRGHKADIFEGGHRIPFIARWPERVRAGALCNQTVCLTDLMATAAALVGRDLPEDAGEDSVSLLPVLLGKDAGPLREATVHHSINGSFAIRQGPWKLILCPDSGGWSDPRPGDPATRDLPPVQLYNLAEDVGERRNVQAEHPEIVERLTRLLER